MRKFVLIGIILGSLCGAAHAQSNVTIGLGAGYSGAGATFTLLNPQGYNGQIQPSPSYTILLNSSGAATLTTLGTGIQYGVLVCKADGTACLKGTVNVTGQAQDISAALEAYPLGTGSGGTPGGTNTQLQYNDVGAFGGTSGLTWNGSLETFSGSGSTCDMFGSCQLKLSVPTTATNFISMHDADDLTYPNNALIFDSEDTNPFHEFNIDFTLDRVNFSGITFGGPTECPVFVWTCGSITLGANGTASGQGTHNLAALVDFANIGLSEGTQDAPAGYVSFYNSAPVQQISIAGDRQGNPAITSLLTSLNQAHLGLVNDTTTDSGAPPYTIASGTFPTITGCGTISATAGGATAGTFTTSTTGTCTAAIPMPTAPHGWTCVAQDITKHTVANILIQSATATNSCTVTGTTAASDVITFVAYGY